MKVTRSELKEIILQELNGPVVSSDFKSRCNVLNDYETTRFLTTDVNAVTANLDLRLRKKLSRR
jgi:hypothetical protein